MRNMGGLRTKTPITFWTMAIATIAIAGLPPFAGFFSKDEILWKTFSSGNILLWGVGAVAAGLTAFYMSRLIFMTFFNKCRASDEVKHHIHESPKTMTFPLIILAGLSMIGGFLNVPHALKYIGFLGEEKVHHLLDPVIGLGPDKILQKAGSTHGLSETAHHAAAPHHSMTLEYGLMFLSIAIALTGIYVAYLMYMKNRDWPKKLAARFATIHKIIFNKWYVDEIYAFLFVRPFHALSNFFWKGIDIPIIDGIVNGIPRLIGWSSNVLKYIQSGHVQNYAVSIVLGTLFLLIYYYLRIIP
jgi:NADH-quinone oxidoreductase subunit L